VTLANVSEARYFEQAIEGVETFRYYVDKGSASAENRAILKKKGIKSGMMYSIKRNKPLGYWKRSLTNALPRAGTRATRLSEKEI
jgi:IS5 family transposase